MKVRRIRERAANQTPGDLAGRISFPEKVRFWRELSFFWNGPAVRAVGLGDRPTALCFAVAQPVLKRGWVIVRAKGSLKVSVRPEIMTNVEVGG